MIAIEWARRARARGNTRVITVQPRGEKDLWSVICVPTAPTHSLLPKHISYVQLFRQRLSHRSAKAYATMQDSDSDFRFFIVGLTGSKSLGLVD